MDFSRISNVKHRAYVDLKNIINMDNYGDTTKDPSKWSITDLLEETDQRRFLVYEILDGVQIDGKKIPERAPNINFVLRVMSRQACYCDQNGNRIWTNPSGKESFGEDNDILVLDAKEQPVPGDKIRIKGRRIIYGDDGEKLTLQKRNKMAMYNRDEYEFIFFEVNKHGCIEVRYPYVKSMLEKSGFRIAYPQFDKAQRPRRITNWLYKEVFPNTGKSKV